MTLPEVPREAVEALLRSFSPHDEWTEADILVNRKHVEAVWPILYAAAVQHATQTRGICGDPAARIVGFGDGVSQVVCALAAGHDGWHAEDSGMRWSHGEHPAPPRRDAK